MKRIWFGMGGHHPLPLFLFPFLLVFLLCALYVLCGQFSSIDDNIAAQRLQTDFVGAFVEAAVELTLVLVDAAL